MRKKSGNNLWKATGREFDVPENLAHASDVIYKFRKEIAAKAKYKLINKNTGEPLKVVDHIGCHYSKMFPSKGVGGAEYPYVLAGMVEEWGGKVIDYPERRHCCGFGFRQYLVQANRGFSIACSKEKFESMEPFKPDMIITNCPGCPMFLDRWQYVINEMEGKRYGRIMKVYRYSLTKRLPDLFWDMIHGILAFRCIRLIVNLFLIRWELNTILMRK